MTIKKIGGMRLDLRPNTSDEMMAIENLEKRDYEHKLKFQIQKGEHWLDMGGYIGAFALRCLQAGARVKSFEPDPETKKCYIHNLNLNGFGSMCIGAAVVYKPKTDTCILYQNELKGNYAANTIFKRWKREKPMIEVPCWSFEKAIKDHVFQKNMNLKLDIESAEWDILEFGKGLKLFDKIVIEFHFFIEKSLIRFKKILRRLARKGFSIRTEHAIPKGDEWKNFRKMSFEVLAYKKG